MLVPLAVCAVGKLAAARPQDPPSVLQVLPLQHGCGWRAGIVPPPWGTMLTFVDAGERPDLLGTMESGRVIEPEQAAALLQQLHRESVDDDKLHIDVQGDGLVLLGSADEVTRVRQEADALAAIVLRPLQVQACLWDAGIGDSPPAVMTPGEWRRFAEGRDPLWRSNAATQPSRPVALDQQRWTRYVRDNDVEIAAKVSISLPITDMFSEGGRVVVTPHTLVGGDDLALHVQFGLARRRGAVRTIPTGVPGQADLEVPQLETVYGTCSGRITNGGALAVTLRGAASGGGQFVLTVQVASPEPPATQALAGITVLPCGALTSDALTQRLAPPPPTPGEGDRSPSSTETEEIGAGFAHFDGDLLQDLLRSALGARGEDCHLYLASGHLFAIAPDAARQQIEAVLLGLQERMLRTVTVRHRGRLGPGDGESMHEIVVPALFGREATVARVLETNVIRNLWAEVAQEASVYDPAIACLQVGSWLRARAVPHGEQVHLQLLAQCTQAPPPQVRNVMPSGGSLMPTDVASVRVHHDGPAVNGQALVHGDGPLVVVDGRPTRTSLDTTIAW